MNAKLLPYAALVEFLGDALGENVEIALHDLSSPEQEVVAIKNAEHISQRTIGAKLSNLSIHYLETKQYEDHDYVMNYKTAGPDGKLLRSATYFIKEEGTSMPIGMLCININITDYEYLESTLKRILGIKEKDSTEFDIDNPIEVLSTPLTEVIDTCIKERKEMSGSGAIPTSRLSPQEKIEIVKELNEKGAFRVKGAIAIVAEKLEVSDPTIYRYLKKI